MKLTSWRPVRWAMALWLALWALDALAYAGFTLDYKLGFSIEHYPYPPNVALLEVTPVWEPMLVGAAGVVLLLAVVLVLKRSRVAFGAVVAPIVLMLLLYAVRASRPESVILQSLSAAYEKSPLEMIWPIAGAAITMLICLALWQDRRALAPRHE